MSSGICFIMNFEFLGNYAWCAMEPPYCTLILSPIRLYMFRIKLKSVDFRFVGETP